MMKDPFTWTLTYMLLLAALIFQRSLKDDRCFKPYVRLSSIVGAGAIQLICGNWARDVERS